MIIDLTNQPTGFCDRLRQVTFCVAVAELRGDRVLRFRERLTEHGPFSFLEVCLVDGFEVLPWRQGDGPAEWALGVDCHPSLASVRRFRPPDLRLDDAALLERWLAAYRRLRPTPALLAKVDALGVGAETLGVHLRWTDKINPTARRRPGEILPRERAAVEGVLRRLIRGRLRGRADPAVFIASDDRDARAALARALVGAGARVTTHEATFRPEAFRQTSGEDFVVDLFALARCREVLGTTPSYVVRTADWISGRRRSTFAANRTLRCRLRELGDALRRAARRWWR